MGWKFLDFFLRFFENTNMLETFSSRGWARGSHIQITVTSSIFIFGHSNARFNEEKSPLYTNPGSKKNFFFGRQLFLVGGSVRGQYGPKSENVIFSGGLISNVSQRKLHGGLPYMRGGQSDFWEKNFPKETLLSSLKKKSSKIFFPNFFFLAYFFGKNPKKNSEKKFSLRKKFLFGS